MTCHACDDTGIDKSFGAPCPECEIHNTNRPKEDTEMPAATKTTASKKKKRSIDWSKIAPPKVESADTWKALAEGDIFEGRLTKLEEVTTRFGDKFVLELSDVSEFISDGEEVDIETADPITFWPTPGALDALAEAGADFDDIVRIQLDELVDTGKGNPYKSFSVDLIDEDGNIIEADEA